MLGPCSTPSLTSKSYARPLLVVQTYEERKIEIRFGPHNDMVFHKDGVTIKFDSPRGIKVRAPVASDASVFSSRCLRYCAHAVLRSRTSLLNTTRKHSPSFATPDPPRDPPQLCLEPEPS